MKRRFRRQRVPEWGGVPTSIQRRLVKRPRLRFRMLCGGLLASLAMIGMWFASQWFDASFSIPFTFICLSQGALVFGSSLTEQSMTFMLNQTILPVSFEGWMVKSNASPYPWSNVWWCSFRFTGVARFVVIPLWMLILPSFAAFFVAWRSKPNPRSRYCNQCDYDLTGNESGVCPECGKTIA